MRPEPFGALLYHFGTRRLSFLKNQRVLAVVRSLADHPSARAACAAAGVSEADLPGYARALATLADSKMIVRDTRTAGAPRPRQPHGGPAVRLARPVRAAGSARPAGR